MSKATLEEMTKKNAISFMAPRPRPFAQIVGMEFAAQTREIPVVAVKPSPYQPRIMLDREHIESLAESIQASRQIEPILVREVQEGEFELIAGEHRLEAIRLLGRDTILATVRQLTDSEARIAALIDNIKRREISDFEAGKAYLGLIDSGEVASPTEMSRLAGVSRQTIYRCIALASLPEEIIRLLNANPSVIGGHAGEALKGLIDEGHTGIAIKAAEAVAAGRLKQKDIESWARAQLAAQSEGDKPASRVRIPAFVCTDERIRGTVMTKGHNIRLDLSCQKDLPPEAVTRLEAHLKALVKELSVPDISDIEMFKGC